MSGSRYTLHWFLGANEIKSMSFTKSGRLLDTIDLEGVLLNFREILK